MRRAGWTTLVFVAWGLLFAGCDAQKGQPEAQSLQPGGYVVMLKGDVAADRQGASIRLKKDDPVYQNDTVRVQGDGFVRIRFSDDSIVAVGKNAEFSVREYFYDAEKQAGKSDVYFAQGAFEVITGTLGKIAPQSVTLQARTATMGIRGTHIVGEIISDSKIVIACVSGAIEVKDTRRKVLPKPAELPKGKIITLEEEAELPPAPREFEHNEVIPIMISTGNDVDEVEETIKALLKILSSAPHVKRVGDRFVVQLGINTDHIPGVTYRLDAKDAGLGHTQLNRASGVLSIVPSDVVMGEYGFSAQAQAPGMESETKRYRVRLEKNREWQRIAAGNDFVIGLKTDGTLHGWGKNRYGQLGDGTQTDRDKPVEIGMERKWSDLAAGYDHVLALSEEGALYAWGRNRQGQLGDGTREDRSAPVAIGKAGEWAAIAAGNGHSLALKTDGTLWAWGENTAGKLGDGTAFMRLTPRQISDEADWSAVAAGEHHNLALKKDGTLWAWGRNDFGQLGNPDRLIAPEPFRIGSEKDWKSISAGAGTSFALRQDGTLYGWGKNFSGQIGDGSDTDRFRPAKVATDRRWQAVYAGTGHTLAIDARGNLYGWGDNTQKQLPVDAKRQLKPIMISQETGWLDVLSGPGFTLAVKPDRTFEAWGPVNRHVVETLVVSVFAEEGASNQTAQ